MPKKQFLAAAAIGGVLTFVIGIYVGSQQARKNDTPAVAPAMAPPQIVVTPHPQATRPTITTRPTTQAVADLASRIATGDEQAYAELEAIAAYIYDGVDFQNDQA